jgi:pyruvate formate-lyase/glycerol dehydratase family glycyl radical enzyme
MESIGAEKEMVKDFEVEAFGGCTPRIRKARQRSLATRPSICLEKASIMTEVFMKTEGEPLIVRRAKAFREACKRKTIFIQDDELIVGHPAGKIRAASSSPETNYWLLSEELDTISTREQDPYTITEEQKKLFKDFIEPYWKGKSFWDIWQATAPKDLQQLDESIVTFIQDGRDVQGHGVFLPDYELVIKIGIEGIKKNVHKKLNFFDISLPGNFEKSIYLKALLIVCDGISRLAKRYATLAREMLKNEKQPNRKAELEEIAKILDQVPVKPARTFWEALQSMWIYHVCALIDYGSADYNPGRMDQYLYPYYKKDIDEGRLTRDQAQELLESLWLKFTELSFLVAKSYTLFVPGYPTFQQATCGGITRSGQDGVNPLSYMMIQAAMDIRSSQPNLSVRYNKRKNPDSFLRYAIDLVALGTGHPQFYNDEVGTKYLMDMGIPFDDAYNWSPLGCKDAGITGKMGNLRVPTMINLAAVLELTLLNGISRFKKSCLRVPQTGDPKTFGSYEQFENAFKAQLTYQIKKGAEIALILESTLRDIRPDLLTSLTYLECIENAKDFMAGGAKYHPGPEIGTVGHADIFNSLAAIKTLVYEEKKLTWDRLLNALDNDFKGFEDEKEMCLAVPKFGNDIAEVDEIGTAITQFIGEEVRKYNGLYGDRRTAETTAAATHLFAGLGVGALPSGRKAWVPLADGISPMHGTDRNGPTAVLKSISKCCLELYFAPLLNMKLDPSLFVDERGIVDLLAFMKTWHDLGLYHVQFNVVSPEMLREAQIEPEKYRSLMVRVSGYCAYFVDLFKDVQDEIIARTTFCTSC